MTRERDENLPSEEEFYNEYQVDESTRLLDIQALAEELEAAREMGTVNQGPPPSLYDRPAK